MSRGHNTNGLLVDTGLLRDHVSKLREQKKLATRLYNTVLAMKNASDPTVAYQYDPILRDVEQMIEYFTRMAKVLTHVGDDAVQLNRQIGGIIEDSTDLARHVSNTTFML